MEGETEDDKPVTYSRQHMLDINLNLCTLTWSCIDFPIVGRSLTWSALSILKGNFSITPIVLW